MTDEATARSSAFTIESFDHNITTWERWSKRFDGACRVFAVSEADKASYLLHYMGPKAFDILCDKCIPDDPYTLTYQEITAKMSEHYVPTLLEVAENFRFQSRKQLEGETLPEFVAALQKLSVNCGFGDHLKKALRNQFVFGISNKDIQAELLTSKDLTLAQAIETATSMELSEQRLGSMMQWLRSNLRAQRLEENAHSLILKSDHV